MTRLNKGAMFGLDARIALAIFGALSVISGAALYSAIQNTRVISQVNSMKEIEKALEAYYLDTGQLPGASSNNPSNDLSIKALVEKPANVNNWNGPYISLTKHTDDYLIGPNGKNVGLVHRESDSGYTQCNKGDDCSIFIWNHEPDLSFRNKIEEYLDGVTPTGNQNSTGVYHFDSISSFYKTNIKYDSSGL
ncbi:MAG TPA: hypothetical protein DCL21_05615 [Alphaproteobacteria bacterium]|nr:hypothetical protein [Alphaproteobacteria bacterium]